MIYLNKTNYKCWIICFITLLYLICLYCNYWTIKLTLIIKTMYDILNKFSDEDNNQPNDYIINPNQSNILSIPKVSYSSYIGSNNSYMPPMRKYEDDIVGDYRNQSFHKLEQQDELKEKYQNRNPLFDMKN